MGFKVCNLDADMKDIFITEYELINQYTGHQIWGWGNNAFGGIGDNTNLQRSSPVQVVGLATNWRQTSTGNYGAGGIKTDGTLWMWGTGYWGTLGNGATATIYSPVQTISGGTEWKCLAAGRIQTWALKKDGTLWGWGWNLCGNLGNNSTNHASSPIQTIAGGTNWRIPIAMSSSAGGIKSDGTFWLWGANTSGQVGDESTIVRSSPVQTIAGGSNWKSAATDAYNHMVAMKNDGTLWAWGRGDEGQLGDGTTISKSSPVQTITGGTGWKTPSAGICHSVALKTDGTLWTWGQGNYGMLGNNATTNVSSPIQTISGGTNWRIGIGGRCTAAGIKTDGTLWVWGRNQVGQLGNNNTLHISSPVQTIAGGTNWRWVAPGGCITTALRLFNGYDF